MVPGKKVTVLVIAKGSSRRSLKAGAEYAGFEEYLEKLKAAGLKLMLL